MQARLTAEVADWVRHLSPNGSRTVVVAAMKAEELTVDFPRVEGVVDESIRAERLRLVLLGIADGGGEATLEHVDSYGAHHAQTLAATHPAALGYVCLSDEIAVGLHHVLEAAGRRIPGRILGFDGSNLTKRSGIRSFDQRLQDIGAQVVGLFLDEFRRPKQAGALLLACREIPVELFLR